jgi:hypothetical protein
MSLSIDKLEYFAKLNGYGILRYFEKSNRLFACEVLSTQTGDASIVFIPKEYNFQTNSDEKQHTIKIVNVADNMEDNIEDFVQITNSDIRQSYSDLEIDSHLPSLHKASMSEHLDNIYKHTIILDDLKEKDSILIKDMYRQLRRLKYCLHGIQHKLAIMNAPYLGIINQDNEIEIYYIDKLKRETIRKLYVVVKLDLWFDKVNVIDDEINQIFTGIYSLLNTNQLQHTKNIQKMIKRNSHIATDSQKLSKYKMQCQAHIDKFNGLLTKANEIISGIQKEIDFEQNEINENDLNADMRRSHKINKLQTKIRKVYNKKETTLKHVVDLKSNYEDVSLSVDSILFDNIIMLDKIFSNFKTLETLIANLDE